ncbi:MAG: sulfurtransferase [Nitrospirae bacterium]|nr:sulfurtransferase [Nitrospirota bacterium]
MFLRKKSVMGFLSLIFLISLFSGYQSVSASCGPPLIEAHWVEANLAKLTPVYVGFVGDDDKKKYDARHIPGSAYLAMGDLMGVVGSRDKAKFAELMGKLGISSESHVIMYSTPAANPFVPGAYWIMKYFGHSNVSILNGSLDKWEADGYGTDGNPVKITPATYHAAPGNNKIIADGEYILKNLKNPNVVIIDTRAENEYTGEKDVPYIKAKGHIPGAVNLNFYPTNRGEGGVYKSVEELKAVYEAAGVTKDKEVITYCEGSPRAADTFFVLKEILGYPNVKVYVGSWMEWGNDPKYPVEK